MIIEIAKFPTEEGGKEVAGIEISTDEQLEEYHASGLAELNEQLHTPDNGLSDSQRAYGLVLLVTLNEYVKEKKLAQMYSEKHNSMNICSLLAEETVTADRAEKISMLDVRLQKFSERRPETVTAAYYALLKAIAGTEPGLQESMRGYISRWGASYPHIRRIMKTLHQARYAILQTEHESEKENRYRELVCFGIERVIYSGNKTIMLFDDGTKTTATCGEGDTYSRETGMLVCLLKHIYGNEICKLLNDFADETAKAEKNESELVYLQDSSKSAVKKQK